MNLSIGAVAARNAEIIAAVKAGETRLSVARRYRIHDSLVRKICRAYEAVTNERLERIKAGRREAPAAPHPPCRYCGGIVERRARECQSAHLARACCSPGCAEAYRVAAIAASKARTAGQAAAAEITTDHALPENCFSAHNIRTRDFGRIGAAATHVPTQAVS